MLHVQSFAVRSLGWVEMAEEDLAPGKSSVAVNNCIRQLSYCKNDIRDTVGIWGEVCDRTVCVSFVSENSKIMEKKKTYRGSKEEGGTEFLSPLVKFQNKASFLLKV